MKSKFLVPFETAKLLKEKGYPQESDYMYCGGERQWRHLTLYQMNKINAVAAPAYCEVLDWLVQKEIYIDVCRTDNTLFESGYRWHCYIWERDTDDWCTATIEYRTREEALNAAILKALEIV